MEEEFGKVKIKFMQVTLKMGLQMEKELQKQKKVNLNDKIKSIIEENNDNIIEINQYNNQNNIYGNNNDIYNGNNDDDNENGVERNDDDNVEINQNCEEEQRNNIFPKLKKLFSFPCFTSPKVIFTFAF